MTYSTRFHFIHLSRLQFHISPRLHLSLMFLRSLWFLRYSFCAAVSRVCVFEQWQRNIKPTVCLHITLQRKWLKPPWETQPVKHFPLPWITICKTNTFKCVYICLWKNSSLLFNEYSTSTPNKPIFSCHISELSVDILDYVQQCWASFTGSLFPPDINLP